MELGHRDVMQALVRVSMDVELEFLRSKKECGPLLLVMTKLRQGAIDSLAALVNHDPADIEGMRKHQNEVLRFDDMVRAVKEIISDGESAMKELDPEEQQEVRRLALGDGAEEDD